MRPGGAGAEEMLPGRLDDRHLKLRWLLCEEEKLKGNTCLLVRLAFSLLPAVALRKGAVADDGTADSENVRQSVQIFCSVEHSAQATWRIVVP